MVDLTSDALGSVYPTLVASSDLTLDEGTVANDGSDFPMLLSASSTALPVELVAVEAVAQGSDVSITWRTASETNNAGFHVERRSGLDSTEAKWHTLGFKKGAGTTAEPTRYRFADTDIPYSANHLSYRLRQVDVDGTVTHSQVVDVEIGRPLAPTLHSPFPNPARGSFTLRYALPNVTEVSIRLFDALGREVATIQDGMEERGRKEIQIPTSGLSSGAYFIRMRTSGTVRTKRLTVVH